MPEAAWCDGCGQHVWVGPDGRCPQGHPPEALSGHYQAEAVVPAALPEPTRRRRISRRAIILIATVAVLFACTAVAVPVWFVSSKLVAGNFNVGNANAGDALAGEMDTFIAEQYPDFDVVQREPFASYHGSGAPGNNYFLASKSEPEFVLVVGVLKPEKIDQRILDLDVHLNGDYVITDSVFSKRADRSDEDMARLVREYVKAKPSPSALVVTTGADWGYASLGVAADGRRVEWLGNLGVFPVTHAFECEWVDQYELEEPIHFFRYTLYDLSRGESGEVVYGPSTGSIAEIVDDSWNVFDEITATGSGDSTIELPDDLGYAGLMEIEHDGSSRFVVLATDISGGDSGLMVCAPGPYRGTVFFPARYGTRRRLEIQADGPWKITVSPASAGRHMTATTNGTGDDVLLYDGEATSWEISHSGESNFIVTAMGVNGQQTIARVTGPYSGTVPVDPGSALVMVTADGDWTITPE